MRTLPAKAALFASFVCQKQESHSLGTAKPVSDSFIPDHPQTIDTRQPKIQYPTTLHLLVSTSFFSLPIRERKTKMTECKRERNALFTPAPKW
jgi:hypothetical protein